jgi:DNA repair exonuclease SbcCD nuclease subunit
MTHTIVAISDLHADISTLGVPRFEEVGAALDSAVKKAIELSAAGAKVSFLFLGDLTDPDNGGATLRAIEIAQRAALHLSVESVSSTWIAGNHCVVDDGTGESALTPMRALAVFENIFVADCPMVVQLGPSLALMCLPFTPICRSYDPDAWARANWPPAGTRVVVAAHLMIPGIVPGEETLEMPRGRDVVFPLEATRGAVARLSGHYHRAQDFDPGDGGPVIRVVGSPLRCSFGTEDHNPSFLVLEV